MIKLQTYIIKKFIFFWFLLFYCLTANNLSVFIDYRNVNFLL